MTSCHDMQTAWRKVEGPLLVPEGEREGKIFVNSPASKLERRVQGIFILEQGSCAKSRLLVTAA